MANTPTTNQSIFDNKRRCPQVENELKTSLLEIADSTEITKDYARLTLEQATKLRIGVRKVVSYMRGISSDDRKALADQIGQDVDAQTLSTVFCKGLAENYRLKR